ncbi:hypothetical protein BCR33DRAFT_716206 [Rhizoclosmatium globosum]|uniref:Uncharacterized protein n=1 Tax=Rhizoclosmatium globosum TaxID=329046 RepID=A0A1Y2CEN9_9FUNG|nr:hypothetical protein BCR33DRAFT_716206 [Rhizoclosmatium globosum]|eukprot:ORY45528.1 hypothetical protein BCR33DRAFT_716206 [Rhizoclosmatium globosum]
MHYALLSNPNLSSTFVTSAGVAIFMLVPMAFTCGNPFHDYVLRGACMVFFLLRVIEIGTFPRYVLNPFFNQPLILLL